MHLPTSAGLPSVIAVRVSVLLVNSSTLKRTLRINNRDLARALELKKTELTSAQHLIMKLRAENQSLLHELNQLRASSNVQTIADFEHEVKRRVSVSARTVRVKKSS